MSDHVRILFTWLRYAEYVSAWVEVPLAERPHYRVRRIDQAWRAVRFDKSTGT